VAGGFEFTWLGFSSSCSRPPKRLFATSFFFFRYRIWIAYVRPSFHPPGNVRSLVWLSWKFLFRFLPVPRGKLEVASNFRHDTVSNDDLSFHIAKRMENQSHIHDFFWGVTILVGGHHVNTKILIVCSRDVPPSCVFHV